MVVTEKNDNVPVQGLTAVLKAAQKASLVPGPVKISRMDIKKRVGRVADNLFEDDLNLLDVNTLVPRWSTQLLAKVGARFMVGSVTSLVHVIFALPFSEGR